MRVELTLSGDGAEPVRHVSVECPPGMRADGLAAALAGEGSQTPAVLVVDGHVVPSGTLVGMPPLLTGAAVTLMPSAPALGVRPGDDCRSTLWELRVAAGPDAGLRTELPTRPCIVGRDPAAALHLHDPDVSRRHLEVTAGRDGVTVRDLGAANGTYVGPQRLGPHAQLLHVGDTLRLGTSVLQVHRAARRRRLLPSDGQGHLLVDPVVVPAAAAPAEIVFPKPPSAAERVRLPLLALLLPLCLAAVIALVMRSPTMLLFGLSGPILSVATWVSTRRGRQRRTKGESASAERDRAAAAAALAVACRAERVGMEIAHPPLAGLLAAAETHDPTVWQREAHGSPDEVRLVVRLGTGARPSEISARGETAPPVPMHRGAPITVGLAELRLLRIVGSRPDAVRAAVNVVARLAVQHGPGLVAVRVVVASADRARDWSFARLLPQVGSVEMMPADVSPAPRPTARERDPPTAQTYLVVVVDGRHALPWVQGWLPATGTPGADRYAVVLLEGSGQRPRPPQPHEAHLNLMGADPHTARLERDGSTVVLTADLPGERYAWRLARALAPLRERSTTAATPAAVPDRVSLLALAGRRSDGGRPTVTDDDLAARWRRRPRSTRVLLGASATGVVEVDLRQDGPHALVAGTTGSGKSELLQTLVASLALANRPDEMSFVLVDYKGGAAFRGCAELPHVVGWVTDLDAHLTRRALVSLTAEIRRRERVLAEAGVPDLEAYQQLWDGEAAALEQAAAQEEAASRSARVRLPRLVIVLDEFRVLAEELPDFVPGLVRLAAVGRSLGVHLVLATQRPGGVVTADMRANLSLRIALRVRDRTDSMDVIETPDAATVSAATPGRAYLRGAMTPLTELQTARVTGSPESRSAVVVTDVTRWWEAPADASQTSGDSDSPPSESSQCGPGAQRDLDVIVAATRAAARSLDIDPVTPPWLTPLPDVVTVDVLPVSAEGGAPLGLEDDPAEQVQRTWCWTMQGHLGIAGSPRSGRSQGLLTVTGVLAARRPPDRLHVYVIGATDLHALLPLPHLAALAGIHDVEHVRLVVDRLAAEVSSRLAAPAAPAGTRPTLLVLVDGWELVAQLDHGVLATELRTVLETGRSVGLLAVVTGARAILTGPLAGLLDQRLVLRVGDPVELALAGIPARQVPSRQPAGRALDVRTHREVQMALLGVRDGRPDPDAGARAVRRVGERWRGAGTPEPDGGTPRAPWRLRTLPDVVSLAECEPLAGVLTVGVAEGDLRTVGFARVSGQRRLVVVGPPGSGRTTALVTLAQGLLATGRPIVTLGSTLSAQPGLRRFIGGADPMAMLRRTDPEDPDRLVEARRAHPDLAVLVDDAERFDGTPLGAVLREIARLADEDDGWVLAVTNPSAAEGRTSALVSDLARGGAGVVLQSRPGAHVLGVTLPNRPLSRPDPPGRGWLVSARSAQRIQVAAPDGGVTS